MLVEETVLARIRELPDEFGPELIREKLSFILGVQEAINSLDRGRGSSKSKVKDMIRGWASQ
jgi:hypothetical protein